MNVSARFRLAIGILGIAALVQTGILVHMMTGPVATFDQIRKSFCELPLQYFDTRNGTPALAWQFESGALEDKVKEKLPFPVSDLSFRRGVGPDPSMYAEMYIVHTEDGKDREHHPDICVRDVQQFPEDVSVRQIVKISGDETKPVQRLCYKRGPGQEMTIYYWHYTFQPHPNAEQTWLQAVHQAFTRKPPSVTVQVTTTAGRDRWSEIEDVLLPALDRTLRTEHLPASVRMGCDQLPIALQMK
jgi:hypothetical protein